jgi:DNA-binding NarL/FixJ family response regulator
MTSEGPVRVAIVNDYEIVVAGIAAVLAPYSERVAVVELDAGKKVHADVDVVLYDSFGQVQGNEMKLEQLLEPGVEAKVVVFSWNTDRDLVRGSLDNGATAYVSKGVTAAELVDVIERVHRGERVSPDDESLPEGDDFGRWPGQELGLTPRESEVLGLICQGLSNQEITERAFIGINTVKTYVRTLYAKIEVDSRTKALLWGIDHGFRPDEVRHAGTSGAVSG